MSAQLQLILGGARSGKSRMAEQRAQASQQEKLYLATAIAGDSEMQQRISHHQVRRTEISDQAPWLLVEEPVYLAKVLAENHAHNRCILVDCLTLWLSNCLHQNCWEQEQQAFFELLPRLSGTVIFVSNEVGLGVVPMGEITRQFVDASGFLHQQLAQCCQQVTLVVAGLPHKLKG